MGHCSCTFLSSGGTGVPGQRLLPLRSTQPAALSRRHPTQPFSATMRPESARPQKSTQAQGKSLNCVTHARTFWVGPGVLRGAMGVPETPRPDQGWAKSLPGRARTVRRRFKKHPRRSKRHPPQPRRHPRRAKRRSSAKFGTPPKLCFLGGHRTAQDGPKTVQEAPKITPKAPSTAQEAPKTAQEAPQSDFWNPFHLFWASVCCRGAWEFGVGHPLGARRAANRGFHYVL